MNDLPQALPREKSLLREYLEREVWPFIPVEELGRSLTIEEENEILGFGPDGF